MEDKESRLNKKTKEFPSLRVDLLDDFREKFAESVGIFLSFCCVRDVIQDFCRRVHDVCESKDTDVRMQSSDRTFRFDTHSNRDASTHIHIFLVVFDSFDVRTSKKNVGSFACPEMNFPSTRYPRFIQNRLG